ncbi:MAG: Uma2 family endonuclease [Bacteroidia bacterium]
MAHPLYLQLLQAPDVRLIVSQVQAALDDEARRRMAFYDWLTPDIKAEFINGEVVMHSPARNIHLQVSGRLFVLLHSWVVARGLGEVHTEKALVSLTRNDYEPDICFWGQAKAALFTDDTMRYPAPDLIVEVLSPSTEARDRGVKFQDYAAHGVAEYWIVDPAAQTIEPYRLVAEQMQYEGGTPLPLHARVSSVVVPGFDIAVQAVFEEAANLQALQGR